jgi:cob(I)alamin adenosyltransferase
VHGLVSRQHLSLDLALSLLALVREEAGARDLSLATAVVDDSGHVLASQRMDGAALGAMQLAVGKAYTAASWATPSGAFGQTTQPGGDDWGWNTTDSKIVVYAGGVPLLVDGELVGAIGASGGAAAEDEECVVAAAAALGLTELQA